MASMALTASTASAASADRLNRGLNQRIILYDEELPLADAAAAESKTSRATFHVVGTTGTHYSVKLGGNREAPTCTCPDYVKRNSVCKHIFFVGCRHLLLNSNPARWPATDGAWHDVWHYRRQTTFALAQIAARNNVAASAVVPDAKVKPIVPAQAQAHTVKLQEVMPDDDCPLCMEPLQEAGSAAITSTNSRNTHWFCTIQCGRCVHKSCMLRAQTFARQQRHTLLCPMCRTKIAAV